MLNAIREKVTVKAGGKIVIQSPELVEGTMADVIVMVDQPTIEPPPISSYFKVKKGKGAFKSSKEVDEFIRAERDAWEK